MVRSMTAAGAVPHFHYCDELDAGPLLEARALLAADPALGGARLTFLPFVLKVGPQPERMRAPCCALPLHHSRVVLIAVCVIAPCSAV